MPPSSAALQAPLDAIAGAGLADALRDFLAPAELAPGTPSAHKDWRHLAAYLREAGFGGHPERWVALLCSRAFREAWFREAAPHLPAMRVPVFFRALSRAVDAGEGEKALAELVDGKRDPGAWKTPVAGGSWDPDGEGSPSFDPCWYRPTPAPDPARSYEDWFHEFGLAMWYAMDGLRNPDAEALLLARSMTERTTGFDPYEMEEIGSVEGIAGYLRRSVARWLREAGVPADRASATAQRAMDAFPGIQAAADMAAAWLERTASGREYVEKFAAGSFETAAGFANAGDIKLSVTMATVDASEIGVPKLKALVATLAYRQARSHAWLERFVWEAGIERMNLIKERGGELAEPLRRAHDDLTNNGKSR